MSNCKCQQGSGTSEAHVPDFSIVGFNADTNVKSVAALEGVHALQLSVCVSASYNAGTNQICFTVPVYGNYCVASPVPIPVSAALKACVQTCGSLMPHGLQCTLYLNGSAVLTKTLFGTCP